jgi:hypothetical protein
MPAAVFAVRQEKAEALGAYRRQMVAFVNSTGSIKCVVRILNFYRENKIYLLKKKKKKKKYNTSTKSVFGIRA